MIICVPVIKTHIRTGITCGLKNMKGVLPGDEKKRTHICGLDRGIADLNHVVGPHYTVVDALHDFWDKGDDLWIFMKSLKPADLFDPINRIRCLKMF